MWSLWCGTTVLTWHRDNVLNSFRTVEVLVNLFTSLQFPRTRANHLRDRVSAQPNHSSFPSNKHLCDGVSPSPHRKRWIPVGISRFSTNVWIWQPLFTTMVGNDRSQGHGGTVIGNHIRSIKPWHFRWPWVTFEDHFDDLHTVVTLCGQLTRDLLTIAEFLVVLLKVAQVHVLSYLSFELWISPNCMARESLSSAFVTRHWINTPLIEAIADQCFISTTAKIQQKSVQSVSLSHQCVHNSIMPCTRYIRRHFHTVFCHGAKPWYRILPIAYV